MERRRDHTGRADDPRRAKRCVRCGFDGPAAQHAGSFHAYVSACPACGVDFYARPPRSYAELEGFIDLNTPPHNRSRLTKLFRRALVILYRPLFSPIYRALVRVPADRMMLGGTETPTREFLPRIKARRVSPKQMVRSR